MSLTLPVKKEVWKVTKGKRKSVSETDRPETDGEDGWRARDGGGSRDQGVGSEPGRCGGSGKREVLKGRTTGVVTLCFGRNSWEE